VLIILRLATIRILDRTFMFLTPNPPAVLGDQLLEADFERGGHIDPQFPSQSEQLRIDGDVGAGFTASSVYSVPHTHELGTRSINVKGDAMPPRATN